MGPRLEHVTLLLINGGCIILKLDVCHTIKKRDNIYMFQVEKWQEMLVYV